MREIRVVHAVNEALREEMRRDRTVFVMGEDVVAGTFATTARLVDEFGPERVRNTPLTEAGFVGAAVGAAMTGMRPVVDMMLSAFMFVAMDQFVQNAAKIHYMFNGQYRVPATFICMFGAGGGHGAQHSVCPYSLFMGVPGLKIAVASSPYSVKGLLKSAIRDDNPVLVFIHMNGLRMKGPVPDEEYLIPLGQGNVVQSGNDLTIVATGLQVELVARVLRSMPQVSAEIIDPQSLVPLDKELILSSVRKTGRLVVVDEGPSTGNFASEVAALVADAAFDALKAPIKRVTGLDMPVPVSPPIESFVLPTAERVAQAIGEVLAPARIG